SPVTRQAMAAFIYRLAGSPAFTPAPGSPFPDVPDGSGALERHPFYDQIMWMADQGITTGYSDGTFRPSAPVSRQAMAAFMFRLAGEPSEPGPSPVDFADVQPANSGGPYANSFYDAIMWMGAYEISTGYGVAGSDVVVYQPNSRVSR